ncbi:MAG: aldo/keto reductase [Dehalococcoidia bacterium]|nr:aldo/keto reductase [Dehalococcoidia bacterium]
MEYRNLGRAGVKVSPYCMGCAYFGVRLDEAESVRMVHATLDAGISFFDTANAYTLGRSEEFLGKGLKGRRDRAVIATKVSAPIGHGPNDRGISRRHIMSQVEGSLRRLGTDHIDLYQLHSHELTTPLEETLRALDDLRRQGKVHYFGTSNSAAWQLCEALWISDRLGIAPITSVQANYSLFDRLLEPDVLPFCQAYGIATVLYGSLAGGWLSGRHHRDQPPPPDSRLAIRGTMVGAADEARAFDVLERLEPMATDKGITLSQLALAWVLAQPGVTTPLIGPRTVEQLHGNLRALEVSLTPIDLTAIDEIVPPGTKLIPQAPAPGAMVIR